MLLNIHLNKELKSRIVDSIEDINGELRAINIGIFSAEIGARQWFHANQLESYAVWKMGKNHIDQFLVVKNGKIQSFIIFKRLKDSMKILNIIGISPLIEDLLKQIKLSIYGNVDKITSIEKVFVYSSEINTKGLKNIIQSNIENITLLNPFAVLDNSNNEKINPFKGAAYAEMGVGFRGIDV